MVARDINADISEEATPGGAPKRLLRSWHRMLSRASYAASHGVTHLAADHLGLRGSATVWVCLTAPAIGAVAGAAIARTGSTRTPEILAGVAGLVWAGVRLLLMRLSARHWPPNTQFTAIRGAWALGLLPYALGITPELRLAAWIMSAAVTFLVLLRGGTPSAAAQRVVGVAWGAQAAVVVAGWIAKNAFFIVLATRR